MPMTEPDFQRKLNEIAEELKSARKENAKNKKREKAAYDEGFHLAKEIEFHIVRHTLILAYLMEQKLISERQYESFSYNFYNFLILQIHSQLGNTATFNHFKENGRRLLINKIQTLTESRNAISSARPDHGPSSHLETDIYIALLMIGPETNTSVQKKNLLPNLQAIADCTDNDALIWIHRRLKICDCHFLQEPSYGVSHFFRRHHTTETWSKIVDMLKTRMMLNALFDIREGRKTNFRHLDNEFATALLSDQRKRWQSKSGHTKADEWINTINTATGNTREQKLNAAIVYYQNKFRQLWPNKPAPVPVNQPLLENNNRPVLYGGQGYNLGG